MSFVGLSGMQLEKRSSLHGHLHCSQISKSMSRVQAAEQEEVRQKIEQVMSTPKGAKKNFTLEMLTKYNPVYVEAAT